MGWVGQLWRVMVRSTRRIVVFLAGTSLIALGFVLIPLPGPGWAVVIAGLAVLATEFTWAERLLHYTKRHASTATGVALRRVTALQRIAFLRRFADRDHDGQSDVVDLLEPELPAPGVGGNGGNGHDSSDEGRVAERSDDDLQDA